MFSLFSGHEMSNWFAWILEGRIIFIDTYLCNNSYDRCAHKSAFAKLFTKRILQVVSDVCLAHGNTDGERRVWLVCVFSGKSCHGIVDHTYLWAISMNNNNLMPLLRSDHTGLFAVVLTACICSGSVLPRAFPPRAITILFSFIHCKKPTR